MLYAGSNEKVPSHAIILFDSALGRLRRYHWKQYSSIALQLPWLEVTTRSRKLQYTLGFNGYQPPKTVKTCFDRTTHGASATLYSCNKSCLQANWQSRAGDASQIRIVFWKLLWHSTRKREPQKGRTFKEVWTWWWNRWLDTNKLVSVLSRDMPRTKHHTCFLLITSSPIVTSSIRKKWWCMGGFANRSSVWFSEMSVSDSAGPVMSSPEEVEQSFLFCKPKFLFLFGSIDREKLASSVGNLPHRGVQEAYREVESLRTPRPLIGPSRLPTGRLTRQTSHKECVCLITNASQTRHESQTHPRMVRWWCIRLTINCSGRQYIIAFPCLFLVSSRLGLSFFLSPHKQNEKLNISWPTETQSRMLARLSRSTRQHPGQSLSLSFCSATDLEVQFDKTLRRAWVNKLN